MKYNFVKDDYNEEWLPSDFTDEHIFEFIEGDGDYYKMSKREEDYIKAGFKPYPYIAKWSNL